MSRRENRIPVMMSDAELNAVDDWRFANRIGTRSNAIRKLVEIAIERARYDEIGRLARAAIKELSGEDRP